MTGGGGGESGGRIKLALYRDALMMAICDEAAVDTAVMLLVLKL